jgi:tetratricopeptide (TPR) repeat protein
MATTAPRSQVSKHRRFLPRVRELALFGAVIVFAGVLDQLLLNRPADMAPTDMQPADTPPAAMAVAFFGARVAANPVSLVDLVRLGEAHFRMARETSNASGYERTGEAARRALELNAGYTAARLLQAFSQLALHDFRAALSTALPLTESRNAATALAIVFDAQLALGDYGAAEASLAQLQALTYGPAAAVRAAGLAELHGNFTMAISLAEQTLVGARQFGLGGEPLAWYVVNSAELHLRYGQLERAKERFTEALELLPAYAPVVAGLGRVALAEGDVEEAVERLREAVAIAPQPETLVALMDAAKLAGDDELEGSAVAQLDALVLLSDEGGGLCNRALALYLVDRGGDLDVARRLAEREAASRDDAYSFDTLAWVLFARGDIAAAQAASERALDLGTRDPLLLYHAALIRFETGNDVEARAVATSARHQPAVPSNARDGCN